MRYRSRVEEGQASLLLLLVMTVTVTALTVLLMRLGDANEARTQAQTAADAAALAAVSDIQDSAAESMVSSGMAFGSFDLEGSRSRAENYATQNEAELTDLRATGPEQGFGMSVDTVRVEVQTEQCQREIAEDGDWEEWSDDACPTLEEREAMEDAGIDPPEAFTGNADAIARVNIPSCQPSVTPGAPPVCGGVTITDFPTAQSVIDVQLVDEEEHYLSSAHDPDEFPYWDPDEESGDTGGESDDSVSSGSPREIAQDRLDDFGWDQNQWDCLDNLWERESNWDHTAENPSSGAYGIPQSLPADKMAESGSDWRTNPATQIDWGLNYIDDRYGSPCAAWSHSESTGWY